MFELEVDFDSIRGARAGSGDIFYFIRTPLTFLLRDAIFLNL